MDVVFGLLFVSYFLSKVIQIDSLEIFVGTFRVLRKHPQLRQCAAGQKHVYVGARISDQTGVCEGLPRSWGRNQTIESGYGYMRKFHQRINYEPPMEGNPVFLKIPGVLNEGAKIDIHLTWTETSTFACYIECDVVEYTNNSNGRVVQNYLEYSFPRPQEFDTANRGKISYVAERNTLYLLVDDQVVGMMNLTRIRLNYVEGVTVYTNTDDEIERPKLRIRMMEFTEA